MNLSDQLQNLFARTAHDIKLGLETEQALLERLGKPHEATPCIHVAGTNGKGSVCAMIESVYRAAGYRTGLYTSPHLVRFNERIQVNGVPISDEDLVEVMQVVDEADRQNAAQPGGRLATFFEFTTALAFEYFRRRELDVVVLETGLGGRLDATNVVQPLAAVITPVSIEHTAWLGKTMESIAKEKAGIIKPGCPVILAPMDPKAREVIEQVAAERQSLIVHVEKYVGVRRIKQDEKGQKIQIESESALYRPLVLPLLGAHQLGNCATAVATLEYLNEASHLSWEEDSLKKGLETVKWPGRLQVIGGRPLTILDVAHNPAAAKVLAVSLKDLAGKRPLALVAGLLSDKDAHGFFQALAPLVKKAWLVPLPGDRNMPMSQLRQGAVEAGLKDIAESTITAAQKEAAEWAIANDGVVCIAGSLVLAGEILKAKK
jgi:dihydrofolate synthase/folylpolyglutamate synthase